MNLYIIDVFALCCTSFGLATTLGFGVVQLNAGLKCLNLVSESFFNIQAWIVIIVMIIAIISALSGVSKGVKLLSQLNIYTAILLLIFVLVLGSTVYILTTFSEGLGNYLNNLFTLTFNTY